jgi:hypothetical protein
VTSPETKEPRSASGRPTETAPPAYEPPAIAWEEPFEPIAATSCGLANPFEMNCAMRPQV